MMKVKFHEWCFLFCAFDDGFHNDRVAGRFKLNLFRTTAPYKKVFSLFVLLYIGSRICISFINPKSASTAT